jgi:alcohol-forming fatty acyl-CoA reductase
VILVNHIVIITNYYFQFSLVRVQQKIAVGIEVLQFFTIKPWDFNANEMTKVRKSLNSNEFEMFPMDTSVIKDPEEFIKTNLYGGRVYCLKDPLSTLPRARIIYKM